MVVDVAEVGIIAGVGMADVGGVFTDGVGVADVGGVFTPGDMVDGVGVADVSGAFTSVVAVGLRPVDIAVVADTVGVDSGMDEFEGDTAGDIKLHK